MPVHPAMAEDLSAGVRDLYADAEQRLLGIIARLWGSKTRISYGFEARHREEREPRSPSSGSAASAIMFGDPVLWGSVIHRRWSKRHEPTRRSATMLG
ncbi:hypothetical protein ABZ746_24420 [Streptomyces sp. NPDC020096]